ncbi:hypothetical protein A5725_00935 [Mycobacterium kubicae]|uniref:MmpS family transport accessory protein n=1 Tax=Mycobacterium kubicae TaxID=120959 RepID=UPI000800DFF3|nr:MmpS family transport accessory protein [Mycobacterium kubicae]OBF21333.1 hypothetical protein A5725_00935 [Mycobacterium kubicae]
MSGPNPPGREPDEPDFAGEPSAEAEPAADGDDAGSDFGPDLDLGAGYGGELEPFDAGHDAPEITGATDIYSRAYSAPESEQFISGQYVPADLRLYDYDDYEEFDDDEHAAPRWPWVVGVAAIVAAIALVVSVSLLVTRTGSSSNLANPATTTTSSTPPVQDEITTTTPPPAPPPASPSAAAPPPPTTPAGPRQVTYTVTGTKAPGDIISVTYVDASGRRRTQHNVYIPWSITVTPISNSDVGSVEASSLFRVSRLNCSITTNDGTVLSSNSNDAWQTSC